MIAGPKLLQTIELSYTTTPVDVATMTSLGAVTQDSTFIHVYDTSGSQGQILDSDSNVLINYPAGGTTNKENVFLYAGTSLYLIALKQSMTSGSAIINIYGG